MHRQSWANHVVIIKCSVEPDHSYFTAIQLNKCSKAAVFPSLSSLFLSLSPFFASPHWCNIRAYSSFVTYSKNIQKVIEYFQQVTFPEFVAQALPLYNFSLEKKKSVWFVTAHPLPFLPSFTAIVEILSGVQLHSDLLSTFEPFLYKTRSLE